MITQQTDWSEYTGSDEQIAEMQSSKDGFIVKSISPCILNDITNTSNIEGLYLWIKQNCITFGVTHYWIIPDDPLREMKIRHAQTGQPVWIRLKGYEKFSPAKYKEYWFDGEYSIVISTAPDWNIPNAEYSFAPWED